MLLNGRNTPEGLLHLLNSSECSIFMAACSVDITDIRSKRNMSTLVIPEEAALLDEERVPDYDYSRDAVAGLNDPVFVLQTSGTSGLQKVSSPDDPVRMRLD